MKKVYKKPMANFPLNGIVRETMADKALLSGTGNDLNAGDLNDIDMGNTANEDWDW